MLTLKNIKKIYKTSNLKQTALDNINLSFRKNEFVAILGPSGSGKTTLLNIIGALDNYTEGDLIINNLSTHNFKENNWDYYRNTKIGFIFQNYNLINHISVYKNVELALTLNGISRKKSKKVVMSVLQKVGLEKYYKKKPNELSGGQMQRVAIARALVNNPDIILADEPTGALDSKTSIQIMELIKNISKNKLVIMVTHNEALAQKYANRIIILEDGKIKSDSKPFINKYKNEEKTKIKKTKMGFFQALSLSLNNIKTKKGRTFLTAFASSIGIIGIALVLSISNGFNKKINEYEKDTMSLFPIVISPSILKYEKEQQDFLESKDELYAYNENDNKSVHINNIKQDYIDYINRIDKKYVNAITYNRLINLNLISKKGSLYKYINSSMVNFVELPNKIEQNSFLRENYDLLSGSLPVNSHDLVLILGEKNRVDKSILEGLFIDSNKNITSFDEVVGKGLKLVSNDDYYTSVQEELFVINKPCKELYDKSKITLKITGIIRPKKNNSLLMMDNTNGVSKIGYLGDLVKEIVKENKESKIVKAQQESKNIVFMGGLTFEEAGLSKNSVLKMLGKDEIPYSLNIYPKNFKGKDKIISYLDSYNKQRKQKEKIIYTDYAKDIRELSGTIMGGITIILISFSSISLIVSSVMIGIITYISVLERTKEIGILRSLGARKKDISRVFSAETLIIGLISGVIAISMTLLLLIPVNYLLYNLTGLKNIGVLNPFHAIILILISIILTLTGGFIPSLKASKKDPVEALRSE